MKHLFFLFCYLFVIFYSMPACAQTSFDYVDLKVKLNKEMPLRYFFKDVIVLDNRFDTVSLYTIEDAKTPLKVLTFKETAAKAIRGYITGRTNHLEKNNEILLINLLQFRVPNKPFIKTMDVGYSDTRWLAARDFVYFSADIYAGGDNGFYRKLFSINKRMQPYTLVKETVRDILDDLVEIAEQFAVDGANKKGRTAQAYKNYKRDTASFSVYNSAERITIDQITEKKTVTWKQFRIYKNDHLRPSCIYLSFDDFKNNLPVRTPVSISFNTADSAYDVKVEIKDEDGKLLKPWAVEDSSGRYIRLLKDKYLKLTKDSTSFCFYVPSTLPDMYQILSAENVASLNSYHRLTGSAGASPAVVLEIAAVQMINLIKMIDKQTRLDKIAHTPHSMPFRNCFIDMDTGDIIY